MSRRTAIAVLVFSFVAASMTCPTVRQPASCGAVGFDLSGDRTRPFHTRLLINQPYLDKIASPPDAAALTPMFEQLAQLQREGKLPPWRVPPARWQCLLQGTEVRDERTCGERMVEATARSASPLSPCVGRGNDNGRPGRPGLS